MAVNAFSKEEVVAFEDLLQGFEDALVLSRNVNKYGTNGQLMERANDTIWRPMPYIAQSQDRIVGSAVTPNNMVQLSVPSRLGYQKNSTWTLNALELRDMLQENRLGDAAKQKLASDINTSVATVASLQGTLVVPITTAAGNYDNVALCDSIMNEQGVPMDERTLGLNSRDYNGMAGNLQVASRSFGNAKSDNAYERSYVGQVAGFETLKFDTGLRITAAAATGITMSTLVGAANYWVPKATRVSATGEMSNVDNRYQTITVSATTNIAAGDCFTISGVEAVHHITKQSTGQLKTFRVISVEPGGTTMVISPPIISNQGGTDAEAQYQNVTVAPSGTANLVWLNADATGYNIFWRKPAIEILPGRYAVPTDEGVQVIRGTTKQGIEVVMGKSFSNTTFVSTYTLDVLYGVVMTAPEQAGILLFNQVP
jgi:hypothetical protein